MCNAAPTRGNVARVEVACGGVGDAVQPQITWRCYSDPDFRRVQRPASALAPSALQGMALVLALAARFVTFSARDDAANLDGAAAYAVPAGTMTGRR